MLKIQTKSTGETWVKIQTDESQNPRRDNGGCVMVRWDHDDFRAQARSTAVVV